MRPRAVRCLHGPSGRRAGALVPAAGGKRGRQGDHDDRRDRGDTGGRAGPEGLARYRGGAVRRSEEHTSELQSLIRTSYAVLCLTQKTTSSGIVTLIERSTIIILPTSKY